MQSIFPTPPKERMWQRASFWLLVAFALNTTIILLFIFTPLRGLLISENDLERVKEAQARPEALARLAERYEALRSADLLQQLQRYEAILDQVREAESLRRRSWQTHRSMSEQATPDEVLPPVGPYALHPEAPARAEAVLKPAAETDGRAAGLYRNVRTLELSLRGRATLQEGFEIADIPHPALTDLAPEFAAARLAIWNQNTLDPLKSSYARADSEMQRLIRVAEDFLESLITIRETIELPPITEIALEAEIAAPIPEDTDALAPEEDLALEEMTQRDPEEPETLAEAEAESSDNENDEQTGDASDEETHPSLHEALADLSPSQMENLLNEVARGDDVRDIAPLVEALSGEDFSDEALSSDRRWIIEDGTLQNAKVLTTDDQGSGLHERIRNNPIVTSWAKEGIPARVITPRAEGAVRSGIVYVDSWYIVGPFENDGRYDFKNLLPPQIRFDLDGRYTGKKDREVQWTFNQSPHPSVLAYPLATNAIYYFYTELYLTEPVTTWVVFGSDDGAQFWLNDILVFQSHHVGHAWKALEGFRRVHFRKGVNRIFARVETVPGTSNISMMIFPTSLE